LAAMAKARLYAVAVMCFVGAALFIVELQTEAPVELSQLAAAAASAAGKATAAPAGKSAAAGSASGSASASAGSTTSGSAASGSGSFSQKDLGRMVYEFRELDLNGDGYLSQSELESGLYPVFGNKFPEWWTMFLAEADVDNDNHVSFDEFVNARLGKTKSALDWHYKVPALTVTA